MAGRCFCIMGIFRFGGKKHYTWVWIKNGMIQDAGYRSWEPTYIRDAEEAIDLKGNLVLPGFSDSHVHFVPSAVDRMKVNLNGSRNFEEIGQRLKDWVERHPQESTVHACCLEVSDLEEKRPPTRNVIDHYLRDYSVLIESRDFHYTVLNTRALHSSRVPLPWRGGTGRTSAAHRNFPWESERLSAPEDGRQLFLGG